MQAYSRAGVLFLTASPTCTPLEGLVLLSGPCPLFLPLPETLVVTKTADDGYLGRNSPSLNSIN